MNTTPTIHKASPRDVFLYIFSVGTLYVSIWQFISLLFEYINVLFPDDLHPAARVFNEAIRMSISILLIVFPVYLATTWFLAQDAIKNPEKREMKTRKWLLYFTLFLAAITMIVDLVVLVNNFLEGELTMRFVLKVLTVLAVALAVFAYYLWDLKREITPESKPAKWVFIGALIVVLAGILSGFFIIGSPTSQRDMRFDEERVRDLDSLQYKIIDYWRLKQKLPVALDDLKDDIKGFTPPVDPQTKEPYTYGVLSDLSFQLCAVFKKPSASVDQNRAPSYYGYGGENWSHDAGEKCFTRTIDPELYKERIYY